MPMWCCRPPTYLEKRDVTISDHHPFSRLSEKAIEPLGDSRHEIWVMQQLAKRLGLTADWLYEDPWASLEEDACADLPGRGPEKYTLTEKSLK